MHFIKKIELLIKKIYWKINQKMKELQLHWSLVSVNWRESESTASEKHWITIRRFSSASAFNEYQKENKKSVLKSKGLRKGKRHTYILKILLLLLLQLTKFTYLPPFWKRGETTFRYIIIHERAPYKNNLRFLFLQYSCAVGLSIVPPFCL